MEGAANDEMVGNVRGTTSPIQSVMQIVVQCIGEKVGKNSVGFKSKSSQTPIIQITKITGHGDVGSVWGA